MSLIENMLQELQGSTVSVSLSNKVTLVGVLAEYDATSLSLYDSYRRQHSTVQRIHITTVRKATPDDLRRAGG